MDVAIRLSFVAMIVLWCTKIMNPFIMPLLWGLIIDGATGLKNGLEAGTLTVPEPAVDG